MTNRITSPGYALRRSRGVVGAWASDSGNPSGTIPLARRVASLDTVKALKAGGTGYGLSLSDMAATLPIRLLQLLLEAHPYGKRANANDVGICFGLGAQRIVAVKDYRSGRGTIDDSETEYLQRLWSRNPALSLSGLLGQVARAINGNGWALYEVTTDGDGVAEIADLDSLTCYFADAVKGKQKASGPVASNLRGYARSVSV